MADPKTGVLDMELQPKAEPAAALATKANFKPTVNDPALAMIERFAADPNFDVTKLQALMEMRKDELRRVAEQDFNIAMSRAQGEMESVAPDQQNTQTSSSYASYAALDRMARPIYAKHGFGLSFDTQESRLENHVLVVCYVSHEGGFSRTYRADMPADGKGAKGGDVMTKTHAAGSAMSYAQRYLLKLIFNLAVDKEDDDGNAAGGVEEPEVQRPAVPEGVVWIVRCEALGGRGQKAGNVYLSNRTVATVWSRDENLFTVCQQYMKQAKPVRPTLQPGKGEYCPTLKGVTVYEFPSEQAAKPAPVPPVPVDAKDIPF